MTLVDSCSYSRCTDIFKSDLFIEKLFDLVFATGSCCQGNLEEPTSSGVNGIHDNIQHRTVDWTFPGMRPSSDDVHHLMNKSSASFHPKRGTRSRGLRQRERRIKAKRLKYDGIHQSSSGQIDQRISSSCTFIRNDSRPTILARMSDDASETFGNVSSPRSDSVNCHGLWANCIPPGLLDNTIKL
ncbi:unnamed protein product [Protopolystoma xenopodis]|uniref:Uncharacterized protein n=1 Tax=Protopolystoma xenopodis TaxID=117903 RepID=A0A3S4ZJH3_9PLAT|nr:unnamed protein product [Protopolystoma xenopodis]